jgi:hypothetical protein
MKIRCRIILTMFIAFAGMVRAQSTTAPASDLLGEKFQSQAAGIALRPPAEMTATRGPVGSSEIVRFVDPQKKWTVKLNRVLLEIDKPLPLSAWKDKDGKEQRGMLELTTDQFKTDTPGAEILRQDTVNIADFNVGLMVARASLGVETTLTQRAIIRASDLQYYLLVMTSPAQRGGDVTQDPGVQSAVNAFSQMLDSVQLLDQTAIKEDQDERLFRTRTLLINFTDSKLRGTLQNEQWLRIIQDGKDIGYTYVVEEVGRDLPRKGHVERGSGPEGVLIGIRSRILADSGAQTDSESWLFSTFDRKSESWSKIAYTLDPRGGKMTTGEVGITRSREKPVADPDQDIGGHRGMSSTLEYRLEVTKVARNASSEPIVRDLPPFYLPQALGHLLPRLVPLRDEKSYLFAAWVTDAGQLMYRYIDVGSEQEVVLGGKRMRAVPVKDRIGLEGSVTTDYISPDGKFLGSVNEDTKTTILPTDAATLDKLWKNVNLSRPGNVEP